MAPIILLVVFIGIPVLLGMLLRVRSLYLYVSVVVGQMLVLYVGDDAAVAMGSVIRGQYSQVISTLLLLLIPFVFTVLILKHTTSRSQVLLDIPSLIAVGATLYIFAIPQMTAGVVGSVIQSPLGKSINSSQDIIIAASGIIVVTTMWVTSRHKEHKHKKHHK